MSEPPTVAVVYDQGAVSCTEIASGLRDLGRLVFLLPASEHNTRLRQVLDQLGTCVPVGVDVTENVARLRPLAPAALLTFSERRLLLASELAAALDLPGHSPATAAVLTDKYLQRRRLKAAGVDTPAFHPLRVPADWADAVEAVGLPAVIKPTVGEGSRDTHLVRERQTGAALVERLLGRASASAAAGPTLLAEQFLTGRDSGRYGDYVSVESVCAGGAVAHLAVSGKFPVAGGFREVGQFWPAVLPPDEERAVLELTGRALHALDVRFGVTHTEVKLTPDGPRLIEVNGRLGGHVNELARRACGVDLVEVAGRVALGEAPPDHRLRPDRTYFQYNNPAPTQPARLLGVEGVQAVRRIAGITSYRPYLRPGDRLEGGSMTRPLDLVCGEATDQERMLAILDQVLDTLSFDFELDGSDVRLRARELHDRW